MLHRAVENDSLSEIARYYQRDFQLLAWLNGLSPPYPIRAGEYVYIPPANDDSILRSGTLTLAGIQEAKRRGATGNPIRRLTAENVKSWAGDHLSEKKPENLKTPILLRETGTTVQRPRVEIPTAPARIREKDFIWPLAGHYARGFSDKWGEKHRGVDIVAPLGTPVRAARSGCVLLADTMPGYGRMVLIDHGDGFATLYAHLSKTLAVQGERVRQNQAIGLVGDSGRADKPHLHFELRYNAIAVDPEKYLPRLGSGSR